MSSFEHSNEYSVTDYKNQQNHYFLKQRKYKTKETLSWKKKKGIEDDSSTAPQIKKKYDTSYYFPRKWILGEHKGNKGKMGKAGWCRQVYANDNYIRSIIKDDEITLN